ncbi:sulfur carrier protein ThiS [Psychrosphaera sp. 1_MG-2023]|uniref:Sulfur carrier protein ThiS n=1 Tax=Psychrosphaera algicola TaxID=3023714 RepID=A0ABT5FCM1_9GAMM|nr:MULTISPECIES: sulfur carrier protein ThiS [unclassified Psychrosphaera]MDC2888889.1 sulfur carrier protein ThiS [Psychrosphaera sp. G1-22]MDO6719287.1 sulfur carrier protein ThiS [Psychrosphaera sp. 1_MG-2023]
MKLFFNGEPHSIELTDVAGHQRQLDTKSALSLSSILVHFAVKPPFAVALNGEFVANNNYQTTLIKENDKVDVVSPIFGG